MTFVVITRAYEGEGFLTSLFITLKIDSIHIGKIEAGVLSHTQIVEKV